MKIISVRVPDTIDLAILVMGMPVTLTYDATSISGNVLATGQIEDPELVLDHDFHISGPVV